MDHAALVHESAGRFRVRVPARRGDEAWLARVEAGLREHPSVREVTTRARTGSVVVRHAGTRASVESFARDRGLFEVAEASGPNSADRVVEQLSALHRGLSTSRPEHKLKAVLFYGLLGGAAVQIARGKFLPAGEALLLQALTVLSRAGPEDGSGTLVDGQTSKESGLADAGRASARGRAPPDGRH